MAVEGKLGTVRIAPQVLTTIARLTVLGTPMLQCACTAICPPASTACCAARTHADGVRIEIIDDAVNVDLFLVAAQDANL
jgi:uncharacterized alkaline shock family protein YloU